MKLLLLAALPMLLAGCASDVPAEDRDFFYHGWMRPEQSAQQRLYGRNYTDSDVRPDGRHPLPSADPTR